MASSARESSRSLLHTQKKALQLTKRSPVIQFAEDTIALTKHLLFVTSSVQHDDAHESTTQSPDCQLYEVCSLIGQ